MMTIREATPYCVFTREPPLPTHTRFRQICSFNCCACVQCFADLLAVCFYQGFTVFHSLGGSGTALALDAQRMHPDVVKFSRLCYLLRKLQLFTAAEQAYSFVLFSAVRFIAYECGVCPFHYLLIGGAAYYKLMWMHACMHKYSSGFCIFSFRY